MKKIYIAWLLLALPSGAASQVQKQVEVSKSYLTEVAPATKLSIVPNLIDTVKIRPDIDYQIAPRSLNTNLATHIFRPATVTYWEFNRPTPFYLKAGAGYPLRSVVDFYATTQNPSIGYALLYLNHEGDWSKILNDAKKRAASSHTLNRIGAAAGRYLGRHILEGTIYYDNRLYHRYGASDPLDNLLVGSRINFGEAGIGIRIGDDFYDNHKVNFDIEAYGTYFHDNSKTISLLEARQVDGGIRGTIGFRFRKHILRLQAGFDGTWGAGDIETYASNRYSASARYSFRSRTLKAEAGLDYIHNRIVPNSADKDRFDYFLPYLNMRLNAGNGAFVPFIEADGKLHDNSFGSLIKENPYVITGLSLPKSTVDYNLRFGVKGNVSNKFAYRLFVCMTWTENARYWFGLNLPQADIPTSNYLQFGIVQARRYTSLLGGELSWRPARDFRVDLKLDGYMHDFIATAADHKLGGGLPAFESTLALKYDHRKFSIGATAHLVSTRYWSNLLLRTDADGTTAIDGFSTYKVPITVDLRLGIDYHLSPTLTIFAEGLNLANERLIDWANYPLQSIGFVAGVKMVF